MCLRLRHAIRAAGIGTGECQCFVLKFAATCLSGAACCAASFAGRQTEWRDAGLHVAKRRDAGSRVVFFCLLCLHEQEKKVASRGETRPLSLATKRCCLDSGCRLCVGACVMWLGLWVVQSSALKFVTYLRGHCLAWRCKITLRAESGLCYSKIFSISCKELEYFFFIF